MAASISTTTWSTLIAADSTANQTDNMTMSAAKLTTSEQLSIFAFSLIICIGVVGNILVLYVFGFRRKNRVKSSTEWLILYLGFVDLLASIFNPSLYIYWIVTDYSWHFGAALCKILPAIGPISTAISLSFLLILALDRYLAIVSPFRRQLSWKSISVACIIAIIISILSYVHYIYFLEYDGKCFPSNNDWYGIPNCTLVILRLSIFAFVFTYTNIMIFKKLQQNKPLPQNVREKRVRQSRCIMRVLLTMGVVFVILVYPREIFLLSYNIYLMIWKDDVEGLMDWKIALQINMWLKVMHTSNSCANIFIYAHMQSRFRRSILKVFYNLGFCKTNYMRTALHSISQSTTPKPSRYSHKKGTRVQSYSKASNQTSPLIRSRRESKDYSAQNSPLLTPKSLNKQISFQDFPELFPDSPLSYRDSPLLKARFDNFDESTTFFQRAQIWKIRLKRDSGYVTDV